MAEKKEKVVAPTLKWNDENTKSIYANVVNISGGKVEISVDLAERVVMTPYTAKRLVIMLNYTLVEYEGKYGTIDIGMKTKSDDENIG